MNNKEIYEAPALTVLVLKAEGIVCDSPLADLSVTYEEETW